MATSIRDRLDAMSDVLSPGGLVVLLLLLGTAAGQWLWPAAAPSGRVLWTFAPPHYRMYEPIVQDWNRTRQPKFHMTLLSLPALERRMLSAFTAGTPAADLLEIERKTASRSFVGPIEGVGFVDLTDRLASEGLLDEINAPSFSPWSTRGRIFGLPHDVHPVMLGYRADIVEAAGIDLNRVETWEDFFAAMRPLIQPDAERGQERYALNFWETHVDHLELLILQAGGAFFDEHDRPVIDSEINARTLATVVGWCVGPERVCADAPDFSASGNKLKVDGYVLACFMPDWMCNIWRGEMPQLAGKVKLMPLPAWTRGGRRTSVWGGSMLGVRRAGLRDDQDFEALWEFAKHLYLSPELARTLYQQGDIVTPVKRHWADPIFDQPDPYFAHQPKGRLYIELAPSVPPRSGCAYQSMAGYRVCDAAVRLARWARAQGRRGIDELLPRARAELAEAQSQVEAQMSRNTFLASPDAAPGGGALR